MNTRSLLLFLFTALAFGQYSDDFNRADGAPGVNWTGAVGTWAVSSNRLVQSQGAQNYAPAWHILHAAATFTDTSVQATMYRSGLPNSTTGLIARYQNFAGNISFYVGFVRNLTGTDEWRIYRYTAGRYTQIGATAREEFVDGSTVRLYVSGSTLQLQLWDGAAWVTKTSGTDSELVSGRAGLRASEQGAQFDDFYVSGSTPSNPTPPAPGTIPQSAVEDLETDLAARVVGPASSTDGAIAQFDGTTGKLLKQFTGTGVLKAAGGVPSVVTGTDSNCVYVDGTSGPCGTGNVVGSGTTVVGMIPAYTDTTATGIGPGYLPSIASTADSLVRRNGSGDIFAASGTFAGQLATTNLVAIAGGDVSSAVYRRYSAGQVNHIVRFEDEAGGLLSAIGSGGGFTGNAATASALSVNPANCSAGQAAAGIAADGSAEGCFTPAGGGGGATGSYTQSFTSQTSVTLTHGLGSKNILVACYDGSDQAIDWNTLVATSTSAAAVTFTSAQTGRCTVTIGGGSARYSTTFSSQTSVTITGATHNLGTPDIHVQCRDGASPRRIVEPNTVDIDDSTFDVVITFSVAQSGRCTIL